MAHNLALTAAEVQLILRGLTAISPSGGGSPQATLARKLAEQTGIEAPEFEQVGRDLAVAAREFLGEDLFDRLEAQGELPEY